MGCGWRIVNINYNIGRAVCSPFLRNRLFAVVKKQKKQTPNGCLLLYYFACIKVAFQGFSFNFPQIKNAQPLGLSI